MRISLNCLLPIICAVACVESASGQDVKIHGFPFSAHIDSVSTPIVGPEGAVWFTAGYPLRLMKLTEGEFECIFDTGVEGDAVDPVGTPDGAFYFSSFEYGYEPGRAVWKTNVELPWAGMSEPYYIIDVPAILDADMRMYCMWHTWYYPPAGGEGSPMIWEMFWGQPPLKRFSMSGYYHLDPPMVVSAKECWATCWSRSTPQVLEIDLDAGEERVALESWDLAGYVVGKSSDGVLWFAGYDIQTFDGESLSEFAPGRDYDLWYTSIALSSDQTAWATWFRLSSGVVGPGIARFKDGESRVFTVADGLLSNQCGSPLIDYDGNVWLVHNEGLSRITDGGWPPMRLMLNRVETPDSISVEAQVINNGPVVGVDVYLALEMNGQLLFWPGWQPTPSPVQVNLRPGHNQTATIISGPRASIPPGTYTFFSCMTGRNTHKLIGPIDRKFESLTIEIRDRELR